jgi:hypothetical protein
MRAVVIDWPKKPVWWVERQILNVSIPFTWNLARVKEEILRLEGLYPQVRVGGPAVDLLPGTFADLPWVEEGGEAPGALQRVNPKATRTTLGCTRRCGFCGVGEGRLEPGGLRELPDWPDRPTLCDNNLLAASDAHVEKVLTRLIALGAADFNQGLDARLLRREHAELMARIKKPMIRLALDRMGVADEWDRAFEVLRSAGIAKAAIRSYVLVGFDSGPEEAEQRCQWVKAHGVDPLPMWFHRLDAPEWNAVTPEQKALGWTDYERRRLMQWWYRRKKAKLRASDVGMGRQIWGTHR